MAEEFIYTYTDMSLNWAGVVDLFAPDAVFDAQTVYGRTMTGSAELLDFFENAPDAVAHHPTGPWSEFDGARPGGGCG